MTANDRPEKQDWKPAYKRRRWLGYIIAAVVATLALYLLYRTLSRYDWLDLVHAVTAVSWARLFAALGFSVLSYLALTSFDWLALQYVGCPLDYRKVAIASFASLSIGHSLGLAALSSGAIRYRYYTRWGLDRADVAQLIVFCGATVGLGLAALGGIALLVAPEIAINALGLSPGVVMLMALVTLACPVLYLGVAAFATGAIHIRGHKLAMPKLWLAVAQCVFGPLNFVFVAAALHQTVLSVAEISYFPVVAAYVSANVATIVSHVPGGLGVIEAVLTYLLPGQALIGAILVFRFVYFLIPLCAGLLVLGVSELFFSRTGSRRVTRDHNL
ncbi:lysylphosphatidylglycerol synthase domain-containing protein [Sulfitobacter sp. PS-8MA]|uniref:lysylphosphatidylglycerol synthase domain-containing protein n=1 Tax=Sulfitobacter sp. PS-8MA TaxID=3237707 RepID=UPI0034C66EB8